MSATEYSPSRSEAREFAANNRRTYYDPTQDEIELKTPLSPSGAQTASSQDKALSI